EGYKKTNLSDISLTKKSKIGGMSIWLKCTPFGKQYFWMITLISEDLFLHMLNCLLKANILTDGWLYSTKPLMNFLKVKKQKKPNGEALKWLKCFFQKLNISGK